MSVRILIVDDDRMLADSLSDLLKDEGYDTELAKSGEVAIAKVKESFFDLIIMDIKMPGMNGVESYKEIKKISPKTVVLMMTGYSVSELISEALKEGAYGIFYKPLDIKKLLATIKSIENSGGLVMIVDSDEASDRMLRDVLEQNGYAVNVAHSGKEAIEMQRKHPKEIVFIEMTLPVLNGLEIYQELKDITPKIIAIIMTADKCKTQDMIEKAIDNGAYTCLYKPFDPVEALDIVREISKRKK